MTSVTAQYFGRCELSGQKIRPGDQITPWDGSWALVPEVIEFWESEVEVAQQLSDYRFTTMLQAGIEHFEAISGTKVA